MAKLMTIAALLENCLHPRYALQDPSIIESAGSYAGKAITAIAVASRVEGVAIQQKNQPANHITVFIIALLCSFLTPSTDWQGRSNCSP
jgi:hypothetical protein